MNKIFFLNPTKITAVILIFFLTNTIVILPVYTQNKSVEKYLLPPKDEAGAKKTPEPYNPDEFSSWTYFLYRFLAVSVGVFPLAVLVSSIGFDTYKTIAESQNSGQFEQKYMPLFFGGAEKPAYTSDEVGVVLLTAMGVSLTVGLIDFIIAIIKDAQSRSLEDLFRDDEYGSPESKNVL